MRARARAHAHLPRCCASHADHEGHGLVHGARRIRFAMRSSLACLRRRCLLQGLHAQLETALNAMSCYLCAQCIRLCDMLVLV